MASYCLAYMYRGCSDLLNLIIMLLIKDEKPLVKHRQCWLMEGQAFHNLQHRNDEPFPNGNPFYIPKPVSNVLVISQSWVMCIITHLTFISG